MTAVLHKQLCPKARLQSLIDLCGTVEISEDISAKLYYESGVNMYKQFNILYDMGAWENALCIYWKYENLFFHKIKKHPGYAKVSVNIKSVNAANFRMMKPKGEHAKKELFKMFKKNCDYYIEELKMNKLIHKRDICRSFDSIIDEDIRRISVYSVVSNTGGDQSHLTSNNRLIDQQQQQQQQQQYETNSAKSGIKEGNKNNPYDPSVEIHSKMSFQTARKLNEDATKNWQRRSLLKEPERCSMASKSSQKSKSDKSDNSKK